MFGDGVDRCGLLSLDGTRKAGYNAWELFARMPADRVAIEIDIDERLDGLASISDHRGSVLIWNKADKAIPFNMRLDNILLPMPKHLSIKLMHGGAATLTTCAVKAFAQQACFHCGWYAHNKRYAAGPIRILRRV